MMKTESMAVIGAGRMGSALVRALTKANLPTTVWNRTRSKCEPLAAVGARIADTLEDAVAQADIVVVNVIDYATSDRLLRVGDVAKALRGRLVVQLTSGSPRLAREAAQWAARHEIRYLDGAIMATPDFIATPGATILYAGPRDAFVAHERVWRALGGNPSWVGEDVGHASALDSALLSWMWGGLFGALVGASLCEAEGISLATYLQYVNATAPMIHSATADVVQRIHEHRLTADETTLASLEAHYEAFRHLSELAEEHGIHPAVNRAFDQIFRVAIEAGHAGDDFAVLHRFMRPRG